jgi:hypothetical protein
MGPLGSDGTANWLKAKKTVRENLVCGTMRLAPLAVRDTANFGMNTTGSLNQSFVFVGPNGLSEHEVQLQIMFPAPLSATTSAHRLLFTIPLLR